MNTGRVITSTSNNIGTIEFYHEKSNSMPLKLLEKLTTQITAFGKNDKVKVIIIKSKEHSAFCAGASFDQLLSVDNLESGITFFMGFANLILAMKNCPKFIIGRIHGKTVGGGVGIAAAVDYCIANDRASIRLSELALGIGPFVIDPVVSRKIGKAAMSELTINSSDWKNAQWAKEKGLYQEVYEDQDNLDYRIIEFSNELSHKSLNSMKELKNMFWSDAINWDSLLKKRAEISAKLLMSKESRILIEKIKSKT